jgi:hypothetical protein
MDNQQEKLRVYIKKLLYVLVFVLIFEGLMRKMLPSALGLLVFFLKDILCIMGIFSISKAKLNGVALKLFKNWKTVMMIFIPPAVFTVFHDPILSVFGLKQYLLYMIVGVLMPFAFPPDKMDEFKKFVICICLALIPTTAVAVLQNSLPASHWLNLSVDGGSLEGFSAGGRLRVSSTFSFTGQYSWFLNMACSFLAISFFWPKEDVKGKAKNWQIIYLAATGISLLIGTFITGGRSAVLGCGVCLVMGLAFAAIKSPGQIVSKGLIGIAVFTVLLGGIRAAKPEFFAAYDERSSDNDSGTQSAEMKDRVQGNFLNWTNWVFDQDIVAIMFGNGLGVMSNGSEKISQYAYDLKLESTGTESDFDTTIYEGGIYLAIVWYAFRLWMIVFCLGIWQKSRRKDWSVVLSFLLSYVILNASIGAVGKNPPVNIWLWLAIGSVLIIKNYNDQQDKKLKKSATQSVVAV